MKDVVKTFEAIDPVDETALSGRVADHEWNQMAARITSTRRRLRPWERSSFRVFAVALVAGSGFAFASAIAGDRTIVVDAAAALRQPEAVERSLAAEGITAEVHTVPVKDALVGKWFHLYLDPSAEVDDGTFALLKSYVGEIDMGHEEVERRCPLGDCERTALLEIPGDVKGPLTLVVGRAAEPGEEYWAKYMEWGNELAPSGAFYCLALEEMAPADAVAVLEAEGYEVELDHSSEADGQAQPSRDVTEPPRGSRVVAAYTFEPGVVGLYLRAEDGVERRRRISGTPTEQSGRPDFGTC